MTLFHDWPLWLAIGSGGSAGALLRGVISIAIERIRPAGSGAAWADYGAARATLVVNVLGSLLLGCLLGLSHETPLGDAGDPMRLFWITGVCGALTTVSTLCADVIALTRGGARMRGVLVLGANIVLGISALLLGRAITS